MDVNLSGVPGLRDSITDAGNIQATSIKGIICVPIIAKRGKLGKNYLVGTTTELRKYLGGPVDGNQDYQVCVRAINKGAKLRLTRVLHLTDVEDASTVVGDIATGDLPTITTPETRASATFTITAIGSAGNTIAISYNTGSSTLIYTYTVIGTETPTQAAVTIKNAINAGNSGILVTNVAGALTFKAPVGVGATANTYHMPAVVTSPGTNTTVSTANAAFSGGVTEVVENATISAEEVGTGYNGTTFSVVASASGIANKVDISVLLPDTTDPIVVKNYDQVLTSQSCITLNGILRAVNIDFTTLTDNTLPIASCTLAGGTHDNTTVTDADYAGAANSKSGYHAFDDVADSMRIWNISRPTHEANLALAEYCETRRNMRGRCIVPLGVTIDGVVDFRNGTGIYSHDPIDSLYASLWLSDIYINDPNNPLNKEYLITGLGDQMANRTKTDEKFGEWFSDSGAERGKISGSNGVRINMFTAGVPIYDLAYEAGVNPIVNHPTFKTVSWGNRTMLLNKYSLLSKENIADVVIFIAREIRNISEGMSFNPNDILEFNRLWRKVTPFIKNTLVSGRAIEGPGRNKGEDVWWFWQGDQHAKSLNDLQFNTREDVDAGKYKSRFIFKPIASNEYIALDVAPADSVTIQNIQVLQSL